MTRRAKTAAAVTVERYSKDAYRLLLDGQIVGFAMLLTNGRWIHTDTEDRRQGDATFASPRDVAKAVERALPIASAAPHPTTRS